MQTEHYEEHYVEHKQVFVNHKTPSSKEQHPMNCQARRALGEYLSKEIQYKE